MFNKPELLAPAGDLEKLKIAIMYGADAVYIGGHRYGLRAAAGNFTIEDMKTGVEFAHTRGVKVYVTVNIFAHNRDLPGLPAYLKQLRNIGVDALIVSDPGIFAICRDIAPEIPVHLSTQANTTNWASADFWRRQGVERIVLARELSLAEIKEIHDRVDIELEAFVHGAMCISYSGRCLLSNFMTGRSANLGECTQPCRWKYALVEENRPGQYFPIMEDERGSYIFNSQDLCMIRHIPELVTAGIRSFKIEGRMKSIHYVATVLKAYRQAIDTFMENPEQYRFREEWLEEIMKVSHREYTTGFYFGRQPAAENYSCSYKRTYDFVGLVKEYLAEEQTAVVEQRNRFARGDRVEIVGPNMGPMEVEINEMWDEDGQPIEAAPHPQQIVKIKMPVRVEPFSLIRRAKPEAEHKLP
ncbi:peptidase U32 [Thermincola ferriacetica]|uniref:Peptidase U32 n=2 Tax=Thermincola ferriacetica TaxID=281456 RepID=A0A0L6W493_9FIRM|nr:peptidase U32 [Thermincola ferriacetica]